MPRVVNVTIETPMSVEEAALVFGSTLRIHLIRHYRTNPGSQKDAAQRLGAGRQAVSENTRVLVASGVVYESDSKDGRSHTYRVDQDRFNELWQALHDFGLPDTSE